MKKLLLPLLCVCFSHADAQFAKLKSTVTDFSFGGETIKVQRSTKSDLFDYMLKGNTHRVADDLTKLQDKLDGMQSAVKQRVPINFGDEVQSLLKDIKGANTDLDYSKYEREYEFYNKYSERGKGAYTASEDEDYARSMGALMCTYLVIDSPINAISRFCDLMMQDIPEYRIVLIDSVSRNNSVFYLYRNAGGEDVSFSFNYTLVGANKDLKIKGKLVLADIFVQGQFQEALKVYNKLFNLHISPEEASANGEYSGLAFYRGTLLLRFFNRNASSWSIQLKKRW